MVVRIPSEVSAVSVHVALKTNNPPGDSVIIQETNNTGDNNHGGNSESRIIYHSNTWASAVAPVPW